MQKALSDFNDLHVHFGLEVVKKQITKAFQNAKAPKDDWSKAFSEAQSQGAKGTKQGDKARTEHIKTASSLNAIDPYVNGVKPMDIGLSKTGRPILPDEFDAAANLFKYYEDRIVFSEGSIFIYSQTHWKEVDEYNEGKVILQIQVLYAGKATNSRVTAAYKQFLRLIPKSDRSLYAPNPYIVNFSNGTLHIEKKDMKWNFRFADHDKNDFCTNVIPIPYDETRSIRNPEFEAMVNRVCGVDNDGIEKVRAVKQMYGACVAPIFPHLFMLHGPAKSGKTSLIIPAQKLVHKDNWCSVEPHEFKGFTMESMAGKLVNIVTDIDLSEPIKDNHIKKIEDRIPVRIDRKFKNAVMAPLPAVHIFGGNDIPPTFERGSGAHERRWTFVQIQGLKVAGHYSKSFASDVFDANPIGVLNFALDGLKEVLENNGHYFVPESGRIKMESWQTAHDSVAQFVKEIMDGEIKSLRFEADARIKRSAVWPIYQEWYEKSHSRKPRLNKIKFYEALPGVNFLPVQMHLKIFDGERYFVGLCDTNEIDQPGYKGSPN